MNICKEGQEVSNFQMIIRIQTEQRITDCPCNSQHHSLGVFFPMGKQFLREAPEMLSQSLTYP